MRYGLTVTSRDLGLFNQAKDEAQGSEARVRVGALLARHGRTVVKAHNVAMHLYPQAQHFPGHAERRVIAGQPVFKGTLYVSRIDLSGALAPSFPCESCIEHVTACGCVTKVVYYDGHSLVKVRV